MAEPFRLPRVKVCGLTCEQDVACALEAGADAVGFVHFPPSPRSLEPEAIGELAARVPPGVLTVAVLVDARPDLALAFAKRAQVSALQLCGRERAPDWSGFPLPLLRRLGVDEQASLELERWGGIAAGFVLDHPAAPGGTGRAVELALAAQLALQAPCLLAGGLDGGNVRAYVAAVRPAGVDASSRLEATPGRKDPERVRAFVRASLDALAEVTA